MKKASENTTNTLLKFDPSLKETPLIAAVRDNNLEELKRLLSLQGTKLDVQSYICGTPLVAAAFFGCLEAFKILLENEPKPFDASRHPGLLLTAIRSDQPEIITLLLENSTPLNDSGEKNYQKPPSWFDPEESTPFDNYGPPVFELPIIVVLQDRKIRALHVLIKHKPNLDKKGTLGYNAKKLINGGNISDEVMEILAEEGIENKRYNHDRSIFFPSGYAKEESASKTSLGNEEREYATKKLSQPIRGLTVMAK